MSTGWVGALVDVGELSGSYRGSAPGRRARARQRHALAGSTSGRRTHGVLHREVSGSAPSTRFVGRPASPTCSSTWLFKGTETLGTRDAAAERALFVRMDALQDSILALEARGDTTEVPSLKERVDSLETEAGAHVLRNEFERVLSTNGARGLNAQHGLGIHDLFRGNAGEPCAALVSSGIRPDGQPRVPGVLRREGHRRPKNAGCGWRRIPGAFFSKPTWRRPSQRIPTDSRSQDYMSDIQRFRRPDVEAYFRPLLWAQQRRRHRRRGHRLRSDYCLGR